MKTSCALHSNNERGSILLTSMAFIFIISMLSAVFFLRTTSERRLIEMSTNRVVAFHLAESGVDQALRQLAQNQSYTGTGSNTVALGRGVFSMAVSTPDPANNPNVRKIVSTGYSPSNQTTAYAYQARTITTYVNLNPQSPYTQAVFGVNRVIVQNSTIDSYNSQAGAYGGDNVTSRAHMASNTTRDDYMSFTNSAKVYGSVYCGPNGDPKNVIHISNNSTVTGVKQAAANSKSFSPVTVPDGLLPLGNLNLGGSTILPLPAGTYWYQSISISNNAKIVPLGPVTIYATGNVSIQGKGVQTFDSKPANLTLNVVGDKNVTVSTSTPFYGAIYAPESGKNNSGVRVTGSSTQFYGAVIAYEFRALSNASFHYDEALANPGGGSSGKGFSMVSWKEE